MQGTPGPTITIKSPPHALPPPPPAGFKLIGALHSQCVSTNIWRHVVFSTLLGRVTVCGLSSCYPAHVEVVSLKECTRHISRHLQLHGLSADKAVDSEFKLLLARADNVIAFCSGITVFHNFGHRYLIALGVP